MNYTDGSYQQYKKNMQDAQQRYADEKTMGWVPVFVMVSVVEQYILMNTGRVVTIQVPRSDYHLQLLGRAYDIATGKQFTKL